MFQYRDLTIIDITDTKRMVIACDSSGGIGNKVHDIVQVDPEIVGFYGAHVPLLELLATGAEPVTLINNLCVEMNDTGERIINGIRHSLEPLKLRDDIIITGSTEENIPVSQTGIGVTVIGLIDKDKWKVKSIESGDIMVLAGLPMVGDEVIQDEGKSSMSIDIMLRLLNQSYIKDILPVGSKGILYEMNIMASTNSLEYSLSNENSLDLYRSGGPSTSVILSIEKDKIQDIKDLVGIPINLLGTWN